jgi:CopG family transcriptional regulator / antitoxin EndoAI
MFQDININLPDRLLAEIDRSIALGEPAATLHQRSHFITEAVQFYIDELGKRAIRASLKEGAMVRADRDLALAQDWFGLDEDT